MGSSEHPMVHQPPITSLINHGESCPPGAPVAGHSWWAGPVLLVSWRDTAGGPGLCSWSAGCSGLPLLAPLRTPTHTPALLAQPPPSTLPPLPTGAGQYQRLHSSHRKLVLQVTCRPPTVMMEGHDLHAIAARDHSNFARSWRPKLLHLY